MRTQHRKQIKHYDEPGHVHELTFSCYRRLPLLVDDAWREELCRSIDAATERHHFQLLAFVLMPEHVHLLVQPLSEGSPIPDLLRAIKRPFSFRVKKLLEQSRSPLIRDLTIRQRSGEGHFDSGRKGRATIATLSSRRR